MDGVKMEDKHGFLFSLRVVFYVCVKIFNVTINRNKMFANWLKNGAKRTEGRKGEKETKNYENRNAE